MRQLNRFFLCSFAILALSACSMTENPDLNAERSAQVEAPSAAEVIDVERDTLTEIAQNDDSTSSAKTDAQKIEQQLQKSLDEHNDLLAQAKAVQDTQSSEDAVLSEVQENAFSDEIIAMAKQANIEADFDNTDAVNAPEDTVESDASEAIIMPEEDMDTETGEMAAGKITNDSKMQPILDDADYDMANGKEIAAEKMAEKMDEAETALRTPDEAVEAAESLKEHAMKSSHQNVQTQAYGTKVDNFKATQIVLGDDRLCPLLDIHPEMRSVNFFNNGNKKDLIARAVIENVKGKCHIENDTLVLQIDLTIQGKIGISGRYQSDESATAIQGFPYYLALINELGEIDWKRVDAALLRFAPHEDMTGHVERIEQRIPLPETAGREKFYLATGFQLTREQLAFNRGELPEIKTQNYASADIFVPEGAHNKEVTMQSIAEETEAELKTIGTFDDEFKTRRFLRNRERISNDPLKTE